MTECVSLHFKDLVFALNRYVVQSHASYPNPRTICNVPKANSSSAAPACWKKASNRSLWPSPWATADPHYIWPTIHLQSWAASSDGSDSVSELIFYIWKACPKSSLFVQLQNPKFVSEDVTICTITCVQWHPQSLDKQYSIEKENQGEKTFHLKQT